MINHQSDGAMTTMTRGMIQRMRIIVIEDVNIHTITTCETMTIGLALTPRQQSQTTLRNFQPDLTSMADASQSMQRIL